MESLWALEGKNLCVCGAGTVWGTDGPLEADASRLVSDRRPRNPEAPAPLKSPETYLLVSVTGWVNHRA